MKVAFLGMGRMGRLIASHILDAGHELTIWNRTPGRADELRDRGAREAISIDAAVAGAEAIVLMLFDGESVHEVLGPIAGAAPKGALVIDSTTTGPVAARLLGAEAQQLGLRYVDAPVVGSLPPAQAGTLTIFVGGSDTDVSAARPLLELWGTPDRIRHLGEVGTGNAIKAVINMTLGIAMAGIGDALRLGAALSLDRGMLLDAMEAGPLGFSVTQKRDMLAAGRFTPPSFTLDLMRKDLTVALDAAGGDDGELTVATATLALLRDASVAGLGEADYSAMAGYRAGISDAG